MRLKQIECTILLILSVFLISSCSCYFTAGLNGRVVDDDAAGIQGVSVYAYLSKGDRDAAADSYTFTHDNPFRDDKAYFGTTTNANGDYALKSIKWNTNHPVYGKDGDNATVYLLFFHENYGLVKDQKRITSDSTNDVPETTTMTCLREEKTISFEVRHPNLNRTERYTADYKVTLVESEDASYTKDPDLYIKRTGNTTFTISYLKDATTPKLAVNDFISVENPADASSRQAKKDNKQFYSDTEIENGIKENINYLPEVSTYYLYAKPIKFTYPTINGRLYSTDENTGVPGDNGLTVKLCDSNGTILTTTTTHDRTDGSMTPVVTNGVFTLTTTQSFIDKEYTGDDPANLTLKLTYPDSSSSDKTKDIVIIYPNSGSIDAGAIDRT
jgi:hypothetical protein